MRLNLISYSYLPIDHYIYFLFVCLIVFNATFNSISVTSWRSVLMVEETTDLSQVTDKLYHIML